MNDTKYKHIAAEGARLSSVYCTVLHDVALQYVMLMHVIIVYTLNTIMTYYMPRVPGPGHRMAR